MDIEKEDSEGNEKKQNLVKLSIKSRHSDDSVFSNPYNYLQNPSNYTEYPQKMSIESNVSEKMKINRRKSDLFDKLSSEMIIEQPFPKKYRQSIQDVKFMGEAEGRQKVFEFNRLSSQNVIQAEPPLQRPSLQIGVIKEQIQSKQESNQQALKSISCKCFKSKCLQLYCQCFSKGIYCKKGQCQCYGCRNNEDFKDRLQKAKVQVLERNPEAFSNKLQVVGNTEAQKNLAYKRGCNCKKTMCYKKYCECWNSGVKCTYLCKCENCLNGGQRPFKQ